MRGLLSIAHTNNWAPLNSHRERVHNWGDNDVNNQTAMPTLLSIPGIPDASGRFSFGSLQTTAKVSRQAERPAKRSPIVKFPSLVDWYHILRAHHHWTVFQAIRYALWLAR
jgi:hypothetical protein